MSSLGTWGWACQMMYEGKTVQRWTDAEFSRKAKFDIVGDMRWCDRELAGWALDFTKKQDVAATDWEVVEDA